MRMTFRVIVFGGLAVFLAVVAVVVFTPAVLWQPERTIIAADRATLQEKGREVFFSNGCNYCHTQYVREVDNGMGPVSSGGDYALDNPMILGSERTGPDLSYVGRKRGKMWEIEHLKSPRDFSPMSIMPSFAFLSAEDLDAVAEYLYYLGDREAAERMILSPAAYADKRAPAEGTAKPSTGANPPPQGWPTFIDSGLYEGKLIYVSRCLTCHGCAGNGLGHYAGTLIVTPANYKVEPFMSMSDDQWFWHVSEGVQGTVMPPWRESLTEQQRWNVIRYIQEVYAHPFERDPDEGDPPTDYAGKLNPLPVTIENLDRGKEIWTRECLVCHGDAATGHGPYRQGIEPVPPDFSSLADYADWNDDAYFWRISEGVPWSAMPAWKEQWDETGRWQLVMYVRTMFTQTLAKPADPKEGENFTFPETWKTLEIPQNASYDDGRQTFLAQCAHCHGLAGDGTGPDGQYLNPRPANFHDMLDLVRAGKVGPNAQGEHLAKVSFGIQNTAMPAWGEFLPLAVRWNDVNFLMTSFMKGTKDGSKSLWETGEVPYSYVRTDPGIFQDEIATIDPEAGRSVYEEWCSVCHGSDGKGNGSGTVNLASGSPASFPSGMSQQYIFWRIRAGASNTMMYGFRDVLSETDIWNATAFVVNLTGGDFGG